MWIVLGIIGFILLLITVTLLLPVTVFINTDQNGELVILYKILFKTFGENPDPNQPIVKALKDISGVTRLDKQNLKKSSENGELLVTLKDNLSLIVGLFKRLFELLGTCTVRVLKINIVCAEGDAAKTAINYGICYAIISPLINLIHGCMNVKRKGEQININTDFEAAEGSFSFEIILVTRVFRVIAALFRLAFDEAKRVADAEQAKLSKENQR